jgi:hypothetical protein
VRPRFIALQEMPVSAFPPIHGRITARFWCGLFDVKA